MKNIQYISIQFLNNKNVYMPQWKRCSPAGEVDLQTVKRPKQEYVHLLSTFIPRTSRKKKSSSVRLPSLAPASHLLHLVTGS
jgi:hypothetical protein